MTRCSFTALLCLSFMGMLSACNNGKPKNAEAKRFETLLQKAGLQDKDSVRYVVWDNISCGGCRSYTAQLLQNNRYAGKVKLIIPMSFLNDLQQVNMEQVFVDSAGMFGKVYFGVENVGIVQVVNNEVVGMRSYTAEQLETLQRDLEHQ